MQLLHPNAWVQILIGPRQCGKSTLFAALQSEEKFHEITFDDLGLRQLATRDPALFFQQFVPPLLLDEVQYVPNLFPEIKKIIDQLKRNALFHKSQPRIPKVLFRLTGSNQILMDRNVKESLAGRASYYHLNTLTVHEIQKSQPLIAIKEILFKGGWPELYTNDALSVVKYLNDYVQSYVEKDIVLSAGIQKNAEFLTVIRLCAARTGCEMDYTNMSRDSGVSSVTIKEWVHMLERTDLIHLLKPFHSNLNNRLIKRPKLFFMDTGLAIRLQGWSEMTPVLNSPQIGNLFETLVFAEIIKFIRNMGKNWELYYWRTKDGQEVDFILKTSNHEFHAFEVKCAIHGLTSPISYPKDFIKTFAPKKPLVVITFGGEKMKLSPQCIILPIAQLFHYLKTLC